MPTSASKAAKALEHPVEGGHQGVFSWLNPKSCAVTLVYKLRAPHSMAQVAKARIAPITGQTVENRHLFDVHLGETIAPYVTLEPLKALLPLKRGDAAIPTDQNGPGGIRLGGLERRMRERWQTVSTLWEGTKESVNKLNLLGQMDYLHKLSSQLQWQSNPGNRRVRVLYNQSSAPTAALLENDAALVDYTLYWVACKDVYEANYLVAVINSQVLSAAVAPLMPKGQFGARHLQKHLWKLPIPEFDPAQELHIAIAEAGAMAGAVGEACNCVPLVAIWRRVLSCSGPVRHAVPPILS